MHVSCILNVILTTILVWESIKGEKEGMEFKGEVMEECEDMEGNVLNRKTFDDLKRQGLI